MPVLSPTPAGSSVKVAGPEIVFGVTRIADPSAPVWNAVAVATPVELILSRAIALALKSPSILTSP